MLNSIPVAIQVSDLISGLPSVAYLRVYRRDDRSNNRYLYRGRAARGQKPSRWQVPLLDSSSRRHFRGYPRLLCRSSQGSIIKVSDCFGYGYEHAHKIVSKQSVRSWLVKCAALLPGKQRIQTAKVEIHFVQTVELDVTSGLNPLRCRVVLSRRIRWQREGCGRGRGVGGGKDHCGWEVACK
jgi:hypothetical protein